MANTLAPQVAGCILLGFHLQVTFLHSRVSLSDPFLIASIHQSVSGHDSSISIVYPNGPTICTIRMTTLPVVALSWTSENSIVAAGHDCQPYVVQGDENGWQIIGTLDDAKSGSQSNTVGRLKTGAFATFRDADSRGQSGGLPAADTKLLTIHQNTITIVRPYEVRGGQVTKVSTSGVDGTLVVWDVNDVSALTAKMGSIGLR